MPIAYHRWGRLSRTKPYSHLVDGTLPLKFPRVLALAPMIEVLYALGALDAFVMTPAQLPPRESPQDSSHQVG